MDSAVPDGGFGWCICAAGFMVQFLVLGIHNSFGILYMYLMRDLEAPASDTGLSRRLSVLVLHLETTITKIIVLSLSY